MPDAVHSNGSELLESDKKFFVDDIICRDEKNYLVIDIDLLALEYELIAVIWESTLSFWSVAPDPSLERISIKEVDETFTLVEKGTKFLEQD